MKKIIIFVMGLLVTSNLAYATLTNTTIPVTKNGAANPPTLQNGSITDTGTSSGPGNVGIGSTNPGQALDVQGNGRFSQGINANNEVNLYSFGAKCDEKVETDGVTNGTTTFTSASAIFTIADVGKNIFIHGGGSALSAVGSAPTDSITGGTGSTTLYYKIAVSNPNVSLSATSNASPVLTETTAPATLTTNNYITLTWTPVTGAYAYQILKSTDGVNYYPLAVNESGVGNLGYNFSGTPSSGNLTFNDYGGYSNGTLWAGGTTIYGDLSTTIASFTNSTTVILTSGASSTATGLLWNYGTDDTTALNNALKNIYNSNGGTLVIPRPLNNIGACLINSQIIIPNDNGTANNFRRQPPTRITGVNGGNAFTMFWTNGIGESKYVQQSSALDLRYSGTTWNTTTCPAKICTLGDGKLEIDHLALVDRGNDSSTFIMSTLTTLNIHDVTFIGIDGNGAATNDAMYIGGTDTSNSCAPSSSSWSCYDGPNEGFKNLIDHNYFGQIRRVLVGGEALWGLTFSNNTNSMSSYAPGFGVVDMISSTTYGAKYNQFTGNYLEVNGYKNAYQLTQAGNSTFSGDAAIDASNSYSAYFYSDGVIGKNIITFSSYTPTIENNIQEGDIVTQETNGSKMTLRVDGNVGIGTTSQLLLDVLALDGGLHQGKAYFNLNTGNNSSSLNMYRWSGTSTNYWPWHITAGTGSTHDFAIEGENSSQSPGSETTTAYEYISEGGNVGIGTTLPSSGLSVGANGLSVGSTYSNGISAPSNGLIVQGNVGIGTPSISGISLLVNGNIGIGTLTTDGETYPLTAVSIMNGNLGIGYHAPTSAIQVFGTISAHDNLYAANGTYYLKSSGALLSAKIMDNGTNVGIGSTVPGQALDVQGTIRGISGGTCTTLYKCVGGTDAGVIQTSACVLCPTSSCVALNGCF